MFKFYVYSFFLLSSFVVQSKENTIRYRDVEGCTAGLSLASRKRLLDLDIFSKKGGVLVTSKQELLVLLGIAEEKEIGEALCDYYFEFMPKEFNDKARLAADKDRQRLQGVFAACRECINKI